MKKELGKCLHIRSTVFPWDTPKAEALETGESFLLAVYDVVLDSDGFLDRSSGFIPNKQKRTEFRCAFAI